MELESELWKGMGRREGTSRPVQPDLNMNLQQGGAGDILYVHQTGYVCWSILATTAAVWLEYDKDREAGDEREKPRLPMEMWWLLNW